jgi:hypothetical protein
MKIGSKTGYWVLKKGKCKRTYAQIFMKIGSKMGYWVFKGKNANEPMPKKLF